MTTITAHPAYDLTYESSFSGELGSLFSIDAHGHLDDRDAELFMADVVASEVFVEDPYDFGFEIEHLWRSVHPFVCGDGEDCEGDHDTAGTYHYTEEKREEAVAVTRFQIASPWSRPATAPDAPRARNDRRSGAFLEVGVDYWPVVCVHHPDEPAVTGIPVSRFVEGTVGVDGHIHYCTPCLREFEVREKRARTIAEAELFLEHHDNGLIARADGNHELTTDHLRGLLAGDIEAVEAADRFVTSWKAIDGGYRVGDGRDAFHLYISTVQRLIEDATASAPYTH
ncbi:MAG: hypothetical protein J0J04_08020 [Microbacterium sp.]|uniref:hypothetical protein n=1 Tax=Microbacterium sp. TaxID=51671 RepID=UPI001AD370F6|nr:hypothetical protein [Microbacterium sp.]MBN9214746.1 hypothetical protein [Microbacterium sp.]